MMRKRPRTTTKGQASTKHSTGAHFRTKSKNTPEQNVFIYVGELMLISFAFIAIYLFISLATYYPLDPGWSHNTQPVELVHNKGGQVGAYFADLFFNLFGYFAYLFVFMVAYLGWIIYKGQYEYIINNPKRLIVPSIGFFMTLTSGCGLAIVHFAAESDLLPSHAGGILGGWIGYGLINILSAVGATLLLLVLFFSGISLWLKVSWLNLMDQLGGYTLKILPIVYHFSRYRVWPVVNTQSVQVWHWSHTNGHRLQQYTQHHIQKTKCAFQQRQAYLKAQLEEENALIELEDKEEQFAEKPRGASFNKAPEMTTQLPSLKHLQANKETVRRQKKVVVDVKKPLDIKTQVKQALDSISIEADILTVREGPRMQRVEFQILRDQMQSLRAKESRLFAQFTQKSLRLVETGLDTLNLEIPYLQADKIHLSSLLMLPAYKNSRSALTIALGKNANNDAVIVDLARMPHLLMSGCARSEIDVALHSLLLSLLYKASNEDLRLLFIDSPLKTLSRYADLPHLISPVLYKPDEALQALRWCAAEMERRYRLMNELGERNIEGYNRKVKIQNKEAEKELHLQSIPTQLSSIPYIVLVIHELGLLYKSKHAKGIEELLTRLSQKARSAGIHLILTTNESSLSVVSNLMKNNFPTRIAFRVKSASDSRNLLGYPDAVHLLGGGDMFYLTPATGVPARVHGAQVSLEEVDNVIADLRQQGKPAYIDLNQIDA